MSVSFPPDSKSFQDFRDPLLEQTEKLWAEAWIKFAESLTSSKAGPRVPLVAPLKISLLPAEGVNSLEKLLQDLPMPLDPERLQKFQELQNKNQKERLIEWVNARKAELEVRSMLGTDGGMLSLSHTRFSVSTNEMAVTVAVGLRASTQTERPRIVGVGVDLESTDRMPSQKVVDRIVQKSERAWLDSGQIQALGFWTMKEAAFKATPSNLGSMISDFVISSWDPSTRVATVTSPLLLKQNLSCRAMILTGMGLTVAMALAFEINAERIR